MLLAAVEKGLGGCMIGSFQKEELKTALEIPEYLVPMLVLAIGAPDEEIVLEDACGTITYYRDEKGSSSCTEANHGRAGDFQKIRKEE